MSGENQTPAGLVLARLEGMPPFHPADAKLFTDWTLQAGDIVTVENGEESYNLPIQHLDLEWHGSPTVGVGAEGNEKRQPLPELQRRQYAAGQAAEEEAEYFGTQLSRTNSVVEASAWAAGIQIDPDTGLPEVDPETGEYILAPDGSGHDLLGKISVEAGRITQEVTRATGAENYLSGLIDVQAGRIDLVVTSSGGTNTVNAGIIVDAINATSGGSIVQIDADHIVLNGTTVASSLVGCDVTFGDCEVNGTLTGQLTGNVEGDLNGSVIGEYHVGYFDQGVFFDGAGTKDARDSVTGFGTASESSGTITIPFYTFNSPSPNAAGNITFNIAATSYYQNGIAAATSSAIAAMKNAIINDGTISYTYISSGNNAHKYGATIHVAAADSPDGQAFDHTFATFSGIEAYTAGQTSVTLSDTDWQSDNTRVISASSPNTSSITVNLPTMEVAARSGSSAQQAIIYARTQNVPSAEIASGNLYLTRASGNDTVHLRTGSTGGTSIATISGGYSEGYTEGYNDGIVDPTVTLAGTSSASSNIRKRIGEVSGEIWVRNASGTYEGLRTFSISCPRVASVQYANGYVIVNYSGCSSGETTSETYRV